MKKEYSKFKFVIEVIYRNAPHKDFETFKKVLRYLELEFGIDTKKIISNRKRLAILTDEEFDQDKVADYILNFTEPGNLSIFENE